MSGPWEKYQAAATDQASPKPWEKYASVQAESPTNDPGLAHDVGVKLEENVLFGARPFVAGIGGGIGGAVGQLERPDLGLVERIKGVPAAFQKNFADAKQAALNEEADVSERRPGMSMGVGLGTALATAPLFAAKGLQAIRAGGLTSGIGQAARLGGGLGGLQALGHAENADQAINTIVKGAAIGGGLQFGGNAIAAGAPYVGSLLGKGVSKLRNLRTGISEKDIQTFAQRADEIEDLARRSGGQVSEAADLVRADVTKQIQTTRQSLNNKISDVLKDPAADAIIDGREILKSLDDKIGSVNRVSAKFKKGELDELKNVRDLVKESLDETGAINVRDLFSLKEGLQGMAKPSYKEGKMFMPGDMASKASATAAKEARRILNRAAPEIAEANNQLSMLHSIEDKINKNLITPGKSESALLAAGSGGNQRNVKNLQMIDQITGGNSLKQAENLSALESFGNPRWTPMSSGGTTSTSRTLIGGGVGAVLGGPVGTVAGAAATSPAVLKLELQLQRLATAFGKSAKSKLMPNVPEGYGAAALRSGAVKEVDANARHADNALERRLQEIQNRAKNKKGSGF